MYNKSNTINNLITMKETKHKDTIYPIKAFRISDEVYKAMFAQKKETMLSWNLLFKSLFIKNNKKICVKNVE